MTYDITGSNPNHGHDVTVTAADFAELQNGNGATVSSTGGAHTHVYNLTCTAS